MNRSDRSTKKDYDYKKLGTTGREGAEKASGSRQGKHIKSEQIRDQNLPQNQVEDQIRDQNLPQNQVENQTRDQSLPINILINVK